MRALGRQDSVGEQTRDAATGRRRKGERVSRLTERPPFVHFWKREPEHERKGGLSGLDRDEGGFIEVRVRSEVAGSPSHRSGLALPGARRAKQGSLAAS